MFKECLYTSTPALTDWRNGSHKVVSGDSCYSIANEFCGPNAHPKQVICDYNICTNLKFKNWNYG